MGGATYVIYMTVDLSKKTRVGYFLTLMTMPSSKLSLFELVTSYDLFKSENFRFFLHLDMVVHDLKRPDC